jgi:LacI family transcriptional regulator
LPGEYIITLHKDEDIMSIIPKISLKYTAICGYSDLPVIMAHNTLLHMGVKIPEEVSFLGYGNSKASELLYTPLNTISLPSYDMGQRAAAMLINHIKGQDELEGVVLGVELIERKSVATI